MLRNKFICSPSKLSFPPAFLAHALHYAIHRPYLKTFRRVDVRQFDFMQTKSLSADLAIKMRMQIVVIVLAAFVIVVMGVAVTNFVTDAARAVLYHVHKMMVGKMFQRAEYHRLVDAQESVFEFNQ